VFFLALGLSSWLSGILGAEVGDARHDSWRSHWVTSAFLGG
jgi:hypothetical protein